MGRYISGIYTTGFFSHVGYAGVLLRRLSLFWYTKKSGAPFVTADNAGDDSVDVVACCAESDFGLRLFRRCVGADELGNILEECCFADCSNLGI